MTETQTPLAKNGEQAIQRMSVQDDSQFANLMDTARYDQMLRVSSALAASTIIPSHFQKNPANCFIALQMATRLGVDVFMFMQNTYVVHGKPGMQATLAIALMNSSGLFIDPIDYEVVGNDPFKDDYRVRAFATRKSTNKAIFGPWVDWRTVRAEKWDKKDGSKWLTLPGLMFNYRAAAFFGRLHCPERLMGMLTAEEIEDVTPTRRVESVDITQRQSVPMPKAIGEPVTNEHGEPLDDAAEIDRLKELDRIAREAKGIPAEASAPKSSPSAPPADSDSESEQSSPREPAGASDSQVADEPSIDQQERYSAKYREAEEAAHAAGLTAPAFTAGFKRWLKALKVTDPMNVNDAQWTAGIEAIRERRGVFA